MAALIVAGVAARAAWKTYRKQAEQSDLQAEQLRLLEEDRRSDLAAKFGVWIDYDERRNDYAVRCHNAGPQPVYSVYVFVFAKGDPWEPMFLGNLGPTPEPLLLRKASLDLWGALRSTAVNDQHLAELFSDAAVGVWFRDTNGLSWHRTPSGTLRQAALREASEWFLHAEVDELRGRADLLVD